jgi:hypothetical protein
MNRLASIDASPQPTFTDTRDNGEAVDPAVQRSLAQIVEQRGSARWLAMVNAVTDSMSLPQLVQGLPLAEVFVTYAELKEEERRALLPHLSPPQLDHLLDLDLWSGDQLDPEKTLEWVDRLWGADQEVAVNWLIRCDTELAVAILQQHLAVFETPSPSDTDLVESQDQLPSFTVEGTYYIQFYSLQAATQLRGPLVLLAGSDLEYYLALMQRICSDSHCIDEEMAYNLRWDRLRDEGYLPPAEAYEIYRWPDRDELPHRPSASAPSGSTPGTPDSPATTALAPTADRLSQAISGFEDTPREQLERDLARTSAAVLSADHLPLSAIDSHRQALEKTLGYVGIGLADCSGEGDRGQVLQNVGVRRLFRRGYARVAALGRRAHLLRRQGWLSHVGLGLDILDEPLADVVRALARPRPLFPARALTNETADREFRHLGEIDGCSDLLDQAEALKLLFIDALGLDLAPAQMFDLTSCYPPDVNELTLGLIFRTALAQLVVSGSLSFVPVEAEELTTLATKLSDVEVKELRDRTLSSLEQALGTVDRNAHPTLATFIYGQCQILADALANVAPNAPVDPRFVGTLVVRHS